MGSRASTACKSNTPCTPIAWCSFANSLPSLKAVATEGPAFKVIERRPYSKGSTEGRAPPFASFLSFGSWNIFWCDNSQTGRVSCTRLFPPTTMLLPPPVSAGVGNFSGEPRFFCRLCPSLGEYSLHPRALMEIDIQSVATPIDHSK